MSPLPAPKPSALTKEVLGMKSRVDSLISKMQKDTNFSPTREQLEEIAETIIDFISTHHSKTAPHESYLKAAIIDLTEVPVMAPQMQRISFLTALKDASYEIDLFLSCY